MVSRITVLHAFVLLFLTGMELAVVLRSYSVIHQEHTFHATLAAAYAFGCSKKRKLFRASNREEGSQKGQNSQKSQKSQKSEKSQQNSQKSDKPAAGKGTTRKDEVAVEVDANKEKPSQREKKNANNSEKKQDTAQQKSGQKHESGSSNDSAQFFVPPGQTRDTGPEEFKKFMAMPEAKTQASPPPEIVSVNPLPPLAIPPNNPPPQNTKPAQQRTISTKSRQRPINPTVVKSKEDSNKGAQHTKLNSNESTRRNLGIFFWRKSAENANSSSKKARKKDSKNASDKARTPYSKQPRAATSTSVKSGKSAKSKKDSEKRSWNPCMPARKNKTKSTRKRKSGSMRSSKHSSK
ncbi:unnamed protein product [Nippostrongylus brasiliensis]|uniref:Pollen-specific leucine-rich repeat extensin-like protein 1 n=1 Tax=Nippostrongylus brasiliensis TaxID=27835 RepID=A0A0N4YEK6_NIPBR|nr:unnamed protein product [Nippostrongylus brasiliensis]